MENKKELRFIKYSIPVKAFITRYVYTRRTDEEIIEDFKNAGSDAFDLNEEDYEFYTTDYEESEICDRNSNTVITDIYNGKIIHAGK